MNVNTDRHTDTRERNSETDRQTDRQTDRGNNSMSATDDIQQCTLTTVH